MRWVVLFLSCDNLDQFLSTRWWRWLVERGSLSLRNSLVLNLHGSTESSTQSVYTRDVAVRVHDVDPARMIRFPSSISTMTSSTASSRLKVKARVSTVERQMLVVNLLYFGSQHHGTRGRPSCLSSRATSLRGETRRQAGSSLISSVYESLLTPTAVDSVGEAVLVDTNKTSDDVFSSFHRCHELRLDLVATESSKKHSSRPKKV